MDSVIASLIALAGVISLFVAALTVASILNGWVLSVLWGWFIVPVFHLPALSVVAAIGVSMVVSWLTHHTQHNKDHEVDQVNLWSTLLLRPFLVLGIGYIVHLFA